MTSLSADRMNEVWGRPQATIERGLCYAAPIVRHTEIVFTGGGAGPISNVEHQSCDKGSKWLVQHHGDSMLWLTNVRKIGAWRPCKPRSCSLDGCRMRCSTFEWKTKRGTICSCSNGHVFGTARGPANDERPPSHAKCRRLESSRVRPHDALTINRRRLVTWQDAIAWG